MEYSDAMLYTNISDLQFKDKKQNDSQYMYQMSQTIPKCLMDCEKEHALQTTNYKSKMPTCISEDRGGNNITCATQRTCPHPEYSKYYLSEFLLVPCPKPTHQNYVVCDEAQCCSKRHQLFKNLTKRK